MKQKDVALIIIAVFVGGVVAVILTKILFNPSTTREKVETVTSISSDFQQPDKRFFNMDSIDPTQLIKIGDNNNSQPFSGGQQ